MSAAVIDSPQNEQAQAWWFLDFLVVEHRCAPDMETVVLEMTLPVGSSPPLHVHHSLDDTWYILDGKMVVRCGDDVLVVGAGYWVSMPRGVPHTFRVIGDREARILLEEQGVEFSLSVPFERFAELKQIIQERKRWKRLDDRWSWFESFWKPKKWDTRFRFLLSANTSPCRSKADPTGSIPATRKRV